MNRSTCRTASAISLVQERLPQNFWGYSFPPNSFEKFDNESSPSRRFISFQTASSWRKFKNIHKTFLFLSRNIDKYFRKSGRNLLAFQFSYSCPGSPGTFIARPRVLGSSRSPRSLSRLSVSPGLFATTLNYNNTHTCLSFSFTLYSSLRTYTFVNIYIKTFRHLCIFVMWHNFSFVPFAQHPSEIILPSGKPRSRLFY